MEISKLQQRAKDWRKDNGYIGKCVVVVFFEGEVQGWCNELRDPEHWQPGCIAIDEFGLCYEAVGGNAQEGADMWQGLFSFETK